MSDTGWVTAGAGADNAGVGTLAWGSTGNIVSQDGFTTFVSGPNAPVTSHFLFASSFGFSIPAGKVILGVEARYYWKRLAGGPAWSDTTVKLVIGGAVAGNNKGGGVSDLGGAYYWQGYGGAADTWGASPTLAQVNASNFGVACSLSTPGAASNVIAQIDTVQMRVTYGDPVLASGEFLQFF